MALLLLENFDSLALITDKYNIGSTSVSISSALSRSGSQSMRSTSQYSVSIPLQANLKTGVVGFAFYVDEIGLSVGHYLFPFVSLKVAGIVQISLVNTSAYGFSFYRGSISIEKTGSNLFKAKRWHYMEIKFNIDNSISAGSFVIKIDGLTVHTLTTGLDTQNNASAFADSLDIGALYSNKTTYVDDIYICDLTGSVNNDFLGPISTELLLPDGNGNYSQFSGSDGNSTDNYQLVNEAPHNSDTDYVEATTVNNRDSYAMAGLSGTPTTIHGIQTNVVCKKDDTGAKQGKMFIRNNSTDRDGAAFTPDEEYTEFSEVWEENPDTLSAWTKTTVDAVEAGIKVEA